MAQSWQAEFARKFDPRETPRYIVDCGPKFPNVPASENWDWKICVFEDLKKQPEGEILVKDGYAAISYAWGSMSQPFAARPNYDWDKDHLPIWTDDIRLRSFIPKCNLASDSSKKLFDMTDMKSVFLALGKRFVWWDHACINQKVYYTPTAPTREEQEAMEMREVTRNGEVEKQKYVYQKATAVAIWLHQIGWQSQPLSVVQNLLSKRPTFTIKDVAAGLPPSSEATKRLQSILGTWQSPVQLMDSIKTFKKQLAAITASDPSFSSVWCFQEAILSRDQAFLDRNAKALPWSDEDNSAKLPFPWTTAGKQNVERPGLHALSAMVTFIAAEISYTLANPKNETKADPTLRGLVSDSKSKAELEIALRGFARSGLLYYPENSPCELIAAARRTRVGGWALDRYYGLIGVLGITMKVDYRDRKWNVSKHFLQAVLDKYQWYTLLVAKFNGKTAPDPKKDLSGLTADDIARYYKWSSLSEGIFEPARAYFDIITSLDAFDHALLPKLSYEFDIVAIPTKILDANKQEINNPKYTANNADDHKDYLAVEAAAKDQLVLTAPAGGPLVAWQVSSWTNAVTYDLELDTYDATLVPAPIGPNPKDLLDPMAPRQQPLPAPTNLDYTPKPSFSATSHFVGTTQQFVTQMKRKGMMLVPFQPLGTTKITSFSAGKEADPSKQESFDARCALIFWADDAAGDNSHQGVFGGIIDVYGAKVRDVDTNKITLAWNTKPSAA